MSVIKEFQEFAMRGNVVDLAVGVIMGAAFGELRQPSSTMLSCRRSASPSVASTSRIIWWC